MHAPFTLQSQFCVAFWKAKAFHVILWLQQKIFTTSVLQPTRLGSTNTSQLRTTQHSDSPHTHTFWYQLTVDILQRHRGLGIWQIIGFHYISRGIFSVSVIIDWSCRAQFSSVVKCLHRTLLMNTMSHLFKPLMLESHMILLELRTLSSTAADWAFQHLYSCHLFWPAFIFRVYTDVEVHKLMIFHWTSHIVKF